MIAPQQLLERLDAIGESIRHSEGGLGLLALGSVGLERERLDEYSDLDFFVIVAPGFKTTFLTTLDWLSRVHPIAYAFQNTDDGSKVLYADGIFCEFAIFEPHDMTIIPYAEGRWVWRDETLDPALSRSQRPTPPRQPPSTEWLLGEALTNLYVGLMRFSRGEKLIAQRFIQHFAVDRLIELVPRVMTEADGPLRDPFTPERRIEQRYPALKPLLPTFIQGYEHSPASAAAILAFFDAHFDINPGIKSAIQALLERS